MPTNILMILSSNMIYMHNIKKNRWYLLNISQDLFDTWLVMRSFGSLSSRRERTIWQVCDNEADAWQQLTNIEYNKRQRGYVYADLMNAIHYNLRLQTFAELELEYSLILEKLAKNKVANINAQHYQQAKLF